MKKESNYHFSSFGFSTILLTFVMICIMTFGVLSLVTANSDLKLSQKVAEKAHGLAEAKEISYERISTLDDLIKGIYAKPLTFDNFYSLAKEAINSSELSEYLLVGDSDMHNLNLHWEINITDTQYLGVTVTILSPEKHISNHKNYEITEFYTAHIENGEEIIDDTLHVIGNDE